ncbi:MAG: FHA domain-containing protein [Deltaproteobacteria bacterium]|nr:FHA domain-containing protein [Deltaproteobacteria bacterium]
MYAVVIVDSQGNEVALYDFIDEGTGLISVGGGDDHLLVPDLPAEQVYLYITDGQMVVEDPQATGNLKVDGYQIDAPSYVTEDNDIQVGPYWIRLVRRVARPTPAAEMELPPPGPMPPPTQMPAPPPPAEVAPTGEQPVAEGYFSAGAAQIAMDLAYAPGGPALSQGPVRLVGLSGLTTGKPFILEDGRGYDVGRDSELEVFLDDPTVSRRHARIQVTEGGITILDLRSSNGTYIDGEKTKRGVALPGNHIRFGEVAFRLEEEHPTEAPAAHHKVASPKKTIAIVGIAVSVIALVVIGLAVKHRLDRSKKKQGSGNTASMADKQRRHFTALIQEGKQALGNQQWQHAIEAFDAAAEDYPTAAERTRAQALAARARSELAASQTMVAADQTFDSATNLDGWTRARTLYKKIPKRSYYSPMAQQKLEKVALRIAKHYATEGLTYAKGPLRAKRKAYGYLCSYFKAIEDIPTSVAGEAQLRVRLKELDTYLTKRLKGNKRNPLNRCSAPRFLHRVTAVAVRSGQDLATLLRKKYGEEAIVGAVILYYQGHMDQALLRFSKIRTLRKYKSHRQTISRIQEALALIKGKLAVADAALHGNDVNKADQNLVDAIGQERKILPPPLRSFTTRDAAKRLAERFYALGNEQFGLTRYRKTYRYWSRGKFFDPGHTSILNGLIRLEKVAVRLLDQASSADKKTATTFLERVRDMTEPTSPVHQKALARLKKLSRAQ